MDGNVDVDSYLEKRFRDKKTLEFMKRITVVERPKFTRLFDKGGTVNASDLVIRLKNGKTIRREAVYSRGHHKNPMSDGELEEKFKRLAKGRISREKTERIISSVWNLDRERDVGKLVSMR